MNKFGTKLIISALAGAMALTSVQGIAYGDPGSDMAAAGVALVMAENSEAFCSTDHTAPISSAANLAGIARQLRSGEATTADADGMEVSGLSYDIFSTDETETAEHPAVLAAEARMEAEANSIYNSIAISRVENYVNIRAAADTEAEVVGKIYNNCAANIEETLECEDGTWYKVHSGTVEGYIKAEYFVTGEEAETLAMELKQVTATVNVDCLRMRSEADLGSATMTVLTQGESYVVEETGAEFSRIVVDDMEGYVQNDYIDVEVTFDEAISLEEEQAKLEEAARLKREAEEAAEKLRRQQEEEESRARKTKKASTEEETTKAKKSTEETTKAKKTTEETTKAKKTTEATTEETTKAKKTTEEQKEPGDNGSSELRDAIVSYAVTFAGVLPYVWGGTSLETGADCSGFVQSVYKKFGIKLPRASDDQGYTGEKVSSEDMRPGDLVYYGGHIAIYIGDGKVVHASSAKSVPNTKISTWNYKSVIGIRNVIGD